MEQETNKEIEFDLIQLFKIIFRKWILISVVTFVSLLIVGGYAYFVLDDVYTAESSMIVQVANTGESDYTNLLTGQRLVDTYTEIAESNKVLDQLRINLDIEYSNSQLRSMINVESVNDTLIINLEIESGDKYLATDIANEVVNIVQELSASYEGLDNVEVLDIAKVPVSPSGPNRMLYLVIGVLLGGMIGVGVVLGIEFLDKNIKTGKDVENILGLRLLGLIPDYDYNGGDE